MKNMRFLVADDNRNYRKSVMLLLGLSFSGCHVDDASSANELLEKASREQYSVILTDNDMEDGYMDSGIYAIQEIRKSGNKTPVIMMTGNPNPNIRRRAFESGASDFLDKGNVAKQLADTIKKYIE